MTHYAGTVRLMDLTNLPYNFSGASNEYSGHIGIMTGPFIVNRLYNLRTVPPVIPPVLGQLWPRGIVGEYKGIRVIGTVRLFEFTQNEHPPTSLVGQLWPRGDYIPNHPHV